MSKKQSRSNETPGSTKPSKPTQKKAGKDLAAVAFGTSTSKTSYGRSNSLGGRGGDSAAAASKAGGSLKRGSLGPQPARQAPGPSRSALRLCSSRSFSSLSTTSLSVAPFMRSSRSLSRLDQRSTRDDSEHKVVSKQGNKVQTAEKRSQDFEEQLRHKKDQRHGDNAEKMKTSSSSQPPESSSSLVSTNACHHPSNKGKKQTRDGVYTLCAMTAGMKHNWVHAVLKNVRPGLTQGATSSHSEQEHRTGDWTEGSALQHQELESKVQPEGAQSSADGNSSSSLLLASSSTLSDPPQPPEEAADQCTQVSKSLDASSCVEAPRSNSSTSTEMALNDSNVQSEQQPETTSQRQEQKASMNTTDETCEQQTVQLVKELEQTQRELSRLQQINRNLQDELQLQREAHSHLSPQNSTNSSEQALALKRLQKMNHDLRSELETLKASQEEAREAELRRRVDLLAQQAQLLVTGDATALAQAHLEKDRQQFQEQQAEWERCLASLKTQLNSAEEQRKDTEVHLMQLQQELEGHQQEAEQLRSHLQEVTAQLRANEEAQAQKDARLQKHLALLQESQERERRSLSASLAQAERHSQELQERLDRAEHQVDSLSKSQTWTREIEEAQRQLQEELACTVSAVQRLQEDREQLDRRCQELQNQLSEADREVSRLQGRLKTEETHYYNLEHSYEKVSEELQLALGKVQQREAETQEIREGYERQLDCKEQELSEVLLKMEVLGNSLEETEVKLNDVLKVCTCDPSQQKSVQQDERQTAADEIRSNNSYSLSEHVRTRSRSIDASFQGDISAGDDPERFISLIQLLETKLYVTEEKLRDITQRLQEHQSHISCQDPHICSQLTQSRATAQHLSLLLHSQAKQSQRFAQETEGRSRMLAGRFQVALNIVEVCRERIHATPLNIQDLERQLATVAACLQQGEKDAEKQQRESQNVSKGGGKILSGEILATSLEDMGSVEKCLTRELFVVEKMVSVLQSQHGISQITSVSLEDGGDVTRRYKNIISQRLALKTEGKTATEPLESAISRVCAEAELVYAALKVQQQHESVTPVNKQEDCASSVADISPSELVYYEDQGQGDDSGSEKSGKKKDKKTEAEKEPDWLERLVLRLQTRSRFLRQLSREVSDNGSDCSVDHSVENTSVADLNYMQEQAKLIYLSDRIYLDLEEELQQNESKLQALYKEQDLSLTDEQEALNQTLCQLQDDNNALREELERAEQKIMSAETGKQRLLEDIQKVEDYHKERMQKLETEFQEKIKELQQIHEDEMKHLHGYYTKEKQTNTCREMPHFMEEETEEEFRIQMLDAQQKNLEKLQASCDQELTAVEDMNRKTIEDLQQQHQEEVAELLKEKEQLLQEETAATMAAIVAMRRAHKQELERSRQCQLIRESSDAAQLRIQYEKEIQLLHKELEVLSVQHAEKCLENSQLSQELQDERKSTAQCQKENQELKRKQREAEEMSQLRLSLNGKQTHVDAQVNSFYEMEVILRAREAEMQFLRQEARSLREELKIARMDKLYAQNKLKALYANRQEREDFTFSTWSAGRDASRQSSKDSNDAALRRKPEKASLMRQIVRSKSLKEGLSIQERMKLFESL